jgi:hypothetical protein
MPGGSRDVWIGVFREIRGKLFDADLPGNARAQFGFELGLRDVKKLTIHHDKGQRSDRACAFVAIPEGMSCRNAIVHKGCQIRDARVGLVVCGNSGAIEARQEGIAVIEHHAVTHGLHERRRFVKDRICVWPAVSVVVACHAVQPSRPNLMSIRR